MSRAPGHRCAPRGNHSCHEFPASAASCRDGSQRVGRLGAGLRRASRRPGDCVGCRDLPCLAEKFSLPGKASWAADKTRAGLGSAAGPPCTASVWLLAGVTAGPVHRRFTFTAARSRLRGTNSSAGAVPPAAAPAGNALRCGSPGVPTPTGATPVCARAGVLHACTVNVYIIISQSARWSVRECISRIGTLALLL